MLIVFNLTLVEGFCWLLFALGPLKSEEAGFEILGESSGINYAKILLNKRYNI